jgi:hypothetical protein
MRRTSLIAAFVVVVGCGGGGPGTRIVTATQPPVVPAAEEPQTGDSSRFTADVGPPPPREKRQIDRGQVQKEEVDLHAVDTTLPAPIASAGGQPVPPPPPPSSGTPPPSSGTPPPSSGTPAAAGTEAPAEGSLLVYTARVTMAVYQVEPALDAVETTARDLGGYLAARKDTQIEIRVPRARFDEALRKVMATGDVLHRDISAEDVTDVYVDAKARLENARAVRDRLQALLEKASVKEAIEIQRELERVTGEIEVLEGKLKLLSNRVAYSTIDVLFQPRGAAAVHDVPVRLPFPWLREMGLPRLLDLGGGS